MKKKKIAVLSLVVAMSIVPTFSFANRSKDYNNSSSDRPSSATTSTTTVGATGSGSAGTSVPTTGTEVKLAVNGTLVSSTGATTDKTGTVIGLVVGTKTTTGVERVSNGKGGINVGTVSVHFASGSAETAGLPTGVVAKIDKLNQGNSISAVLGNETGKDLSRYVRVGNTRAVIATDSTTGLTKTAAEIVLAVDVPNGVEMAAVYYDNNTGRWVFVPVVADPITNTVTVTVPGSCTLQLMKKI